MANGGISGLYNGNSVDGANNTQAFFSEARGRAIIVSYVYSADSIQEFQFSNSNGWPCLLAGAQPVQPAELCQRRFASGPRIQLPRKVQAEFRGRCVQRLQ